MFWSVFWFVNGLGLFLFVLSLISSIDDTKNVIKSFLFFDFVLLLYHFYLGKILFHSKIGFGFGIYIVVLVVFFVCFCLVAVKVEKHRKMQIMIHESREREKLKKILRERYG